MPYSVTDSDTLTDRHAILALWSDSLAVGQNHLAKYRWFYQDNPIAAASGFLLRANEDVIGAVAIGARCWLMGDEEKQVGVLADFISPPQSSGIDSSLILLRSASERGQEKFPFLYAFPNSESKAAFRRSGYQMLGQMVRYGKVLRSERYLQRRLPKNIAYFGGYFLDAGLWLKDGWQALRGKAIHGRGRCLYTFDARFDRLWQQVARQNQNTVALCKRDAEYLRWRFSACPEREYDIFVLSQRGSEEINGYIVYYVDDEQVVHIIDLLAVDFESTLSWLLKSFIFAVRKQAYVSISIEFYGLESVVELLAEHDFMPRSGRPIYHVWSHSKNMMHAENLEWFMTASDEDQ